MVRADIFSPNSLAVFICPASPISTFRTARRPWRQNELELIQEYSAKWKRSNQQMSPRGVYPSFRRVGEFDTSHLATPRRIELRFHA